MTSKIALITGITGQDGALLAELLLSKGYVVHGIKRRSSSFNTGRVDHLYHDPHEKNVRFFMHHGDLTDATNLIRIVQETAPTEIYNLAAQSHVQVSFETPEYTANADALGTLRLLEAIRILGLREKVRFYQASTSELYGKAQEVPQRESTPFYPRSPYAAAKLYAYWMTVNYREAYGTACQQRHTLQSRGPDSRRDLRNAEKSLVPWPRFSSGVRRRCTSGISKPSAIGATPATMSKACGVSFNSRVPDDYVLATGETHSVREFVEFAFMEVDRQIQWRGKGVEEKGIDATTGEVLVEVDPHYFRPTEVDLLLGDATKAKERLGWTHKTSFRELVREMVQADLVEVEREYRRHDRQD